MKRLRPAIVLVSVALLAALIGHVVIDILGDFMLAHDTYDDVAHTSRELVGFAALALALSGITAALRAAVREANGSDHAFCSALQRMLPRSAMLFIGGAVLAATAILCIMEGCDAVLAGQRVDDLGDLFGGSIAFGGTIVAVVAIVVSTATLGALRRLARARTIVRVVVAFLRRSLAYRFERVTHLDVRPHIHFRILRICRRIAGRAPPAFLFAPAS